MRVNNTKSIEEQLLEKTRKAKRNKKIKRVLFYLIIVLLLVGIYLYYGNFQKSQIARREAQKVTIEEFKVVEKKYIPSIDIVGTVSPHKNQNIVFRATGSVDKVFVKEGDRVKQGQLLAALDDSNFDYDLEKLNLEISIAEQSGSKRNLDLLNMQKKNLLERIDNTKAYANFDGLVAYVGIQEGDYAETGKVAMSVVDNSILESQVSINERDINLIKEGMSATLSFSSLPLQPVEAHIKYIPILGSTSKDGTGYKLVTINITDVPENLSPGFSFTGKINVGEEKSIILIPQKAVKLDATLGKSFVTKLNEDGSKDSIEVKTKYLAEGNTEVLSGDLKVGDTIIAETENFSMFSVGM